MAGRVLPTCGTCPFFKGAGTNGDGGTCRRLPPVPEKGAMGRIWPRVQQDQAGCGEHPEWPKKVQEPA